MTTRESFEKWYANGDTKIFERQDAGNYKYMATEQVWNAYKQGAGVNLFNAVKGWADERGLILNGSVDRQFLKLIEETGELAAGLARNDHREVVDAIGDIVVVLTILSEQLNTDIETCLEHAWNEIRNRKGKTVNGIFIKESEK